MLEMDWLPEAGCRGIDPNLFFPTRGDEQASREAVTICEACSVRNECLEDALTYDREDDQHGIFGGVHPKIRHELREMRQQPKYATVPALELLRLYRPQPRRIYWDAETQKYRVSRIRA
jgi:hypothetical protein